MRLEISKLNISSLSLSWVVKNIYKYCLERMNLIKFLSWVSLYSLYLIKKYIRGE